MVRRPARHVRPRVGRRGRSRSAARGPSGRRVAPHEQPLREVHPDHLATGRWRRAMSNDMHDELDHGRRHFLGKAAIAIAAARLGLVDAWGAQEREPRQIAALRRATEWLNSPPLSAATLDGKVVLVQFGTYTCINWLRTLPYGRAWDQKYRQGLALIGVHTPEFAFEKNVENVH